MNWLNNLDEKVLNYLEDLKKTDSEFTYYPVKSGITNDGKKLELGFSCYALKILKILNQIDTFSEQKIDNWAKYINSFQSNKDSFFIDKEYLESFKNQNTIIDTTLPVKYLFNRFLNTDYKSNKTKIENYIRAETKQSVSTLFEINRMNEKKIDTLPLSYDEINTFLNSLNWSYPWNSGAQFSALCVFAKTQLNEKNFEDACNSLESFCDNLVNKENGLYYQGSFTTSNEVINGAMKIITGLDWLNIKVHYPEKIIDFCLNYDLSNDGCDIVDVVYVLYRCSNETDYKKKEIINFFENVLLVIKSHLNDDGGFSYFKEKNQTHYYDVKFAENKNQSDIHGTLLCLWAIVMIKSLTQKNYFQYKILKP